MVVTGTSEVRPRGRHRLLPWLVRLVVGLGMLAWTVLDDIREYGLEREGQWGLGVPMAVPIMVATVIVAGVLAALEGWFSRRAGTVWLQCLFAAMGAGVVGGSAALMVSLRFFATRDPVLQSEVESALSSFLLMGVCVVLLALLFRRRRPAGRGA